MSFVESAFFIFLIILFVSYYLAAKFFPRAQWVFLLIASYIFYAYSTSKYLLFLIFTTFTTWIFSLFISKQDERLESRIKSVTAQRKITKEEKRELRKHTEHINKILIIVCLCLNIGVLCFLKYTNFFLGMTGRTLEGLFLPLGISFYTFQSLGYCIDVYRRVIEPEQNIFRYALYVAFFPQISQGPIGKYSDLDPQLKQVHNFDYDIFTKGLARVVLGYFKKIVIANNIGLLVDPLYSNYSVYSGFTLFFATVMYGLQLYADFSGYMDIALGIGECLGIRLAENFQTPYFSKSITEFWRRWHISLGAWFRDYLYYPILRSSFLSKTGRKLSKAGYKKAARILTSSIGLLVTWTVIGFWHGSAWKFVVYGWYHGFFVILAVCLNDSYKVVKDWLHIHEKSKLWTSFSIIRTFIIVNIGYVLFRAPSLMGALSIYKIILTNFMTGSFKVVVFSQTRAYWIILLVGLLICFVIELIEAKKRFSEWLGTRTIFVRWGILYFMITMIFLYIFNQPADAGNFIYFDF